MTDESEAARRGRGVPPAPPPRPSVRPEPKPRSAPPRLIRPSEHLAIVEKAMAEKAMARPMCDKPIERRPPPLMPAVTVLHGPRPAPPPPPPAPRPFIPPTRMPAPAHPVVMRLPQPPRNPQITEHRHELESEPKAVQLKNSLLQPPNEHLESGDLEPFAVPNL
ncbi:unnamed protein product [Colias eurytheme]|nr:unnamed protein product [Colias eurytheme]